MFNLAIDSKLRACDLVKPRVRDVCHGQTVFARTIVMQQKTERPVQFEITEPTREAVGAWIAHAGLKSESSLCLATAVSWFRATYAMYRSGNARPLPLPFPVFMIMDISTVLMRRSQNRLPPNMESGLEKIRFESIISGNYMQAFILLMFSLIAAMFAFLIPR
jgi:hypothetical protein